MATRFEERIRIAREEQRRKELQEERRRRERAEQQAREQRELRDKAIREQQREARGKAIREQQRTERHAEQERLGWQENAREIARQQKTERLQHELRNAQQAAAVRTQQQMRQRVARLEHKQRIKQVERDERLDREKRMMTLRDGRESRQQEKLSAGREERSTPRRQRVPENKIQRPTVLKSKRVQAAGVISEPSKKQPVARDQKSKRRQRHANRRVVRPREEQEQEFSRQATERPRPQRRQKAAELRRTAARQARSERAKKPEESKLPALRLRPLRELQNIRRQTAVRAIASEPPPPEEPSDSLSWLKARGSFLVDEFAKPVYLRGVSLSGLDTLQPMPGQTFAGSLALDDANLSTMTDLWGINLIRLPFHAQTVFSGNSSLSAEEILSSLDEIIDAVTEAGCYILLSMDASGSTPAPGSDTFGAWSLLVNHYQDEPGILYDISLTTSPPPNNWLNTVEMLVGIIRLQNPASLIFVSNGKAGADVTDLPLRFSTGDAVPNLVYAIDVSPGLLPSPDDPQLRFLSASYPVFACPWSDSGIDFGRSSEETANLFERYGMGWVASSWNSEPRMVLNATAHDFAPTRWGLVVRRAIAQPVKLLLPSLRVEDEASNAWRLGS